jgi:hypothetical protein
MQSCVPGGHMPSHARPSAMHALLQTFCPAGHIGMHVPATHSALPPCGAGHGSHEAPQLSAALSLAQRDSQACVPCGQTHVPAAQLAPIGQSVFVQHALAGTHSVPHSLRSAAHSPPGLPGLGAAPAPCPARGAPDAPAAGPGFEAPVPAVPLIPALPLVPPPPLIPALPVCGRPRASFAPPSSTVFALPPSAAPPSWGSSAAGAGRSAIGVQLDRTMLAPARNSRASRMRSYLRTCPLRRLEGSQRAGLNARSASSQMAQRATPQTAALVAAARVSGFARFP